MAAGSGPIRTSVRPSTLSTVFFFTVLGLVPTVIGTTDTDTIVDSLPGVQSRHLHGVPALPQLSAPSPPQLAPLSRRALQTVLSSATDFNRQLHDKSVHPQLQQPHALSPQPSSSPSPQPSSSPSPQLSSSPSPQLSSSALQTVPSSDTDRQLSDLSVHSQLASSPLQQLGSSQLDSSPSPQLSSSPTPQLSSSLNAAASRQQSSPAIDIQSTRRGDSLTQAQHDSPMPQSNSPSQQWSSPPPQPHGLPQSQSNLPPPTPLGSPRMQPYASPSVPSPPLPSPPRLSWGGTVSIVHKFAWQTLTATSGETLIGLQLMTHAALVCVFFSLVILVPAFVFCGTAPLDMIQSMARELSQWSSIPVRPIQWVFPILTLASIISALAGLLHLVILCYSAMISICLIHCARWADSYARWLLAHPRFAWPQYTAERAAEPHSISTFSSSPAAAATKSSSAGVHAPSAPSAPIAQLPRHRCTMDRESQCRSRAPRRRAARSARSSCSTSSTCSDNSDGRRTPLNTLWPEVPRVPLKMELMAIAVLRQLDDEDLLSLQEEHPQRYAFINRVLLSSAEAYTRRANLTLPENPDSTFVCGGPREIITACGPRRRARRHSQREASCDTSAPTPPSQAIVRPWFLRRQRYNLARYAALALQRRIRSLLARRQLQRTMTAVVLVQSRTHTWLARQRLRCAVASAVLLQAHARALLARRWLPRAVASAVLLQACVRGRQCRHLLPPHCLVRSIARARRLAAVMTADALERLDTSALGCADATAVNDAASLFLGALAAQMHAPRSDLPRPRRLPSRRVSRPGGIENGGACAEHGGVNATSTESAIDCSTHSLTTPAASAAAAAAALCSVSPEVLPLTAARAEAQPWLTPERCAAGAAPASAVTAPAGAVAGPAGKPGTTLAVACADALPLLTTPQRATGTAPADAPLPLTGTLPAARTDAPSLPLPSPQQPDAAGAAATRAVAGVGDAVGTLPAAHADTPSLPLPSPSLRRLDRITYTS